MVISYQPNAYNIKVGNLVMLSIPSVMIGIVAAGNSAATATLLDGRVSFQEVTSTGPGQGVMLPPIALPSFISVVNIGAYPILVYPNSGCTIYRKPVPIIVNPSPPATQFFASSPTNWYSLQPGTPPTTDIQIDQHFGSIYSQSVSGPVSLDLDNNDKFQLTLTGDITLSFSGGNVGQTFSIAFVQAGSGGYKATYSGSTFQWAGKLQPVLTTSVGGIDVVAFECPAPNTYRGGIAFANVG